jgi:hypothetical protein
MRPVLAQHRQRLCEVRAASASGLEVGSCAVARMLDPLEDDDRRVELVELALELALLLHVPS